MNGDNPYTPPTVSETENLTGGSGDGWKIYGNTLLVHRGATLPNVDLESGVSNPFLKLYQQPYALVFRSSNCFWSHAEPRRMFLRRFRYVIREILFLPLVLLLMFHPGIDAILPSLGFHFDWFIAAIVIQTAWGLLDRPKLKIEDSAKAGWLRVTAIHPDALAYLRSIAVRQNPHG